MDKAPFSCEVYLEKSGSPLFSRISASFLLAVQFKISTVYNSLFVSVHAEIYISNLKFHVNNEPYDLKDVILFP